MVSKLSKLFVSKLFRPVALVEAGRTKLVIITWVFVIFGELERHQT